MIPYIGDVSRQDAELLVRLAKVSRRVLEFGCGASTQLFAAYGIGTVDSVDTELSWIEKTETNLSELEIRRPERIITFHRYEHFRPVGAYDLIFVDGLGALRLPFALMTWPALQVRGAMCFHDTRRPADVQKVCAVIERYSTEIVTVDFNTDDSNITVITKREPLLPVDYNKLEGRTPEQLGIA